MAENRGIDLRRIAVIGAIGGMLAGMMMAMVEMIYGWASDAHTFWDAPMAISAWVFGTEHFGQPGNHVWPIILGLGGHMVNSMLAGMMFAAAMATVRARGVVVPVMLGVGYGLGLWAVMRYAILPLNDGEDRLFSTDLVSPQWVWWVAHAALGMTAGLVYAVASRARRGPAGFATGRYTDHGIGREAGVVDRERTRTPV